jgi:hypothetical protein
VGVTLNRALVLPDDLRAGEFTMRTESGRAALSCPLCGNVVELPSHFRVEPDGRVVPAFKCRAAHCAFFEYITLADHWLEEREL